MATRKSGPVKPPTLDLKASAKDSAGSGSRSEKSKPAEAKSSSLFGNLPKMPNLDWKFPAFAGGGAIVGALLAYLTAASGLWPTPAPQPIADSPAITALDQRLEALEQGSASEEIAALNAELSTQIVQLRDQFAATNNAIEDLRGQLTKLSSLNSETAQTLSDMQSGQTELRTTMENLSTRIDALAAGADQDQAGAIAETLSQTSQSLADLRQSLANFQASSTDQLNSLSSRLENTETRLATSAALESASSQSMRLPLALSAMEAALNSGRPFATELAALAASQPDIEVPPSAQTAATNGLPSPETIARDFAGAVPAMLAAAPKNPNATWQESLIEQARSLLALRPTDAVEGNSPDALIARTETALAIPDFATANSVLAQMPAAMRDAAPNIITTISTQAEVRNYLTQLRAAALATDKTQ